MCKENFIAPNLEGQQKQLKKSNGQAKVLRNAYFRTWAAAKQEELRKSEKILHRDVNRDSTNDKNVQNSRSNDHKAKNRGKTFESWKSTRYIDYMKQKNVQISAENSSKERRKQLECKRQEMGKQAYEKWKRDKESEIEEQKKLQKAQRKEHQKQKEISLKIAQAKKEEKFNNWLKQKNFEKRKFKKEMEQKNKFEHEQEIKERHLRALKAEEEYNLWLSQKIGSEIQMEILDHVRLKNENQKIFIKKAKPRPWKP